MSQTEQRIIERYDPAQFETKWQQRWQADQIYRTDHTSDKPKYYVLDMYPYPSGDGLSVGHCRNYIPTDVMARFYRMKGYNVLHPMGWDAFGLPAENAAIKLKTNPAVLIERFSANYRRQMTMIGTSYDWSREINSSTPSYYHWTQWIFTQLYNSWYDARVDSARPIAELEAELANHGMANLLLPLSEPRLTAEQWRAMSVVERQDVLTRFRLAYRGEATVNWDPVDKTVIANEEVDADGRAWRSGALVERRTLKQWFFRITAYAERLDRDLDGLDWPNSIIAMQHNWIGRSEGAEVIFHTEAGDEIIVFTTRPDTLWGATFMVLAPEHPLVATLTTPAQQAAVDAYVAQARTATADERTGADRAKTGVWTGGYAINPVNNERVPVWIADYVLMDYGTGAIMAVPAHDERDFAFALTFGLPIIPVIARPDDAARCFVPADCYAPELPDLLRDAGYHVEDDGGNLHLSLTGAQAAACAELIHEHLHSGWSAIAGAGWRAIFPEDIIVLDSPAAERRITQRITLSLPEDEAAERARAGFLHYLAELDAYQPVIYHDDYGVPINSGVITGAPAEAAIEQVITWLEEQGQGQRRRNYRMRDWLISRQRYWGTPIPIIHADDGRELPLDAADLPLTLPNVESYEPTATGESPLALIDDWVNVTLPDGTAGRRETDTMGTFACSSWYFLRFTDPANDDVLATNDALTYWLPVDMYVGGAEHAVMHLLYARFWTKFLHDIGTVSFVEPFTSLRNQGLILAPAKEVNGQQVYEKMSKSKGNVITPDEVVAEYGADALRGYECFISDFEVAVPWNTSGVPGIRRWLDRVWRIVLYPHAERGQDDVQYRERDLQRITHQTIQKVERDIVNFKFNTMVAALMEFTNELYRARDGGLVGTPAWNDATRTLLLLVAPVAPHVAEELWERTGNPYSIHQQAFPVADEALAAADEIEVVVQVNGKVRDKLAVPVDTDQAQLEKLALANERVQGFIGDKPIRKVIVVPGKLVNIVL